MTCSSQNNGGLDTECWLGCAEDMLGTMILQKKWGLYLIKVSVVDNYSTMVGCCKKNAKLIDATMLNASTDEWNQCQLLLSGRQCLKSMRMKYSPNLTPQHFLFFFYTFNFFNKRCTEMSPCWRGSPFGRFFVPVCFHKGLIFIMHYAILKSPRHQFIKTCERESWQEQWKGKRSWDRLRQRGYVSLKRKGGGKKAYRADNESWEAKLGYFCFWWRAY